MHMQMMRGLVIFSASYRRVDNFAMFKTLPKHGNLFRYLWLSVIYYCLTPTHKKLFEIKKLLYILCQYLPKHKYLIYLNILTIFGKT